MPKKSQAEKKVKEVKKIVEDKTFGMKNKKNSKQVKSMIKSVAGQEKGGLEKMQAEIYKEKQLKKRMEEEQKLMADVFAKTAPKNPDENICAFFKAGMCKKGKACKFSHAVTEETTKTNKIDLYTDQRVAMFGNADTIENWNQEKLNEVVGYNEMKYNGPNKTEKICKHFIEAVEKGKYGWFWVCPNGYNCIYRHCLPPDYVFKNQKKEMPKQEEEENVVDKIDKARDKLEGKKLTPVTKEKFEEWLKVRKARLDKERKVKIQEELKNMGVKAKKGLTGRELFEKDSGMFADAEDAVDEYEREENVDVDMDAFGDEDLPDF